MNAPNERPAPADAGSATEFDVVIVGAGFAGLYMLHRARGLGLRAVVFEAGDGVGGTWYWNRYPGARCDVESMEYSYQFDDTLQQEWHWSERFAPQPEILKYANHVADRYDLRRDIRFSTRVTAAHFDEAGARWNVTTDRGDQVSGRFVVMATGCLSSTNKPAFPGLETFTGPTYHTGEWPHEPVDFSGKRVAVIGTGSSAIQSIPIIAKQASELWVFQRTANYSVPARNAPLDPGYEARIKAEYPAFRARNSQMMGAFGSAFPRSEVSIFSASDEERNRAFAERWNRGGLGFVDVTLEGGFGHLQKGHGVAFADFDRDGDLDVFLSSSSGQPGQAWRNDRLWAWSRMAGMDEVERAAPRAAVAFRRSSDGAPTLVALCGDACRSPAVSANCHDLGGLYSRGVSSGHFQGRWLGGSPLDGYRCVWWHVGGDLYCNDFYPHVLHVAVRA